MIILAIESSSRILSVAISKDNKICAEFISSEKFKSEQIIHLIRKVLGQAKLELNDLDYIAVGLGPGSFTGLRIGLACAKGLSLGSGLKIIGIGSLDVIAANVEDDLSVSNVCVVVDAARNNLYVSLFEKTKLKSHFEFRRKLNYSLLTFRQLRTKIKVPTLFTGDGLVKFKELIQKGVPKKSFFADEALWYPKASVLARLAERLISSKKVKLVNRKNILPIYIYPKECQIRDGKTY
jgi:tRNA threonylcarbamoyladenosine biosynthesis protein TsaB